MPAAVRNPAGHWLRIGTALKPIVSGDDLQLAGNIAMANGKWIGIGSGKGHVLFDDSTDEVQVHYATLNVTGTGSPTIKITSTDHIQPTLEFMRPGNFYTDWRLVDDGGFLKAQYSTDDGTSWHTSCLFGSWGFRAFGSLKVQFRDEAIYIASPTDSNLLVNADGSIELKAPDVKLSGDGEITGSWDVGGDINLASALVAVGDVSGSTVTPGNGWTGTFTNGDGATVTVTNGIITGVA